MLWDSIVRFSDWDGDWWVVVTVWWYMYFGENFVGTTAARNGGESWLIVVSFGWGSK
jgi:hypothetical protein